MAGLAFAQPHRAFQSQSPASVVYGVNKDGQQTVEITNVEYQVISPLDTRCRSQAKAALRHQD
jgi:hypothetical protein